jgi:hypothetical protein
MSIGGDESSFSEGNEIEWWWKRLVTLILLETLRTLVCT